MADQEEKRIIVKVAYNYFQEGKWDRALAEYLKLIAIDPMDFLVHNMMAEIYIRKNEKEKAISEFLKAASLLSATNNIEKAVHAYKNVIKLDPENQESITKIDELVRARLIEIDDYVRRGSLKNALEICEKLSMKLPDNKAVDEKIEKIEKLLEKQESESRAREAEEQKEEPGKPAVKGKEELLQNEEVVNNLLAMAEHYEKKQAWDEAVEAYITVLRFQPENTVVQNKLKQLYRNVTQKDKSNEVWARISSERQKAIEQAKRVAKQNPKAVDESEAVKLLGRAGNENPAAPKGKSIEELEKLRIKAEAELRMAVKERKQREEQKTPEISEPHEVLTAEDLGVEDDRDQNIQVLLTQAQMYVQQNMLIEAMRLAQNILELDPQNKEVRNILKQIYDKKNL